MDITIARLNIEHFRRLLPNEIDEVRRQALLRLLADEEAKLATLLRRNSSQKVSAI